MVALSLGTREKFPKYYDYKDLAAIRGPYANAYFLALNKAEEDVDESVQGKLKDKKVHIGMAFILIYRSYVVLCTVKQCRCMGSGI